MCLIIPLSAAGSSNICIAVVTLLYGIVAFTNLGDHETANTTWTPQNGESAVFETDDAYSEIFYLPGIAPADNGIGQRVGTNMKIEVSNDQINWTTAAENTDGSVYAWKNVSVAAVGQKMVRVRQEGTLSRIASSIGASR